MRPGGGVQGGADAVVKKRKVCRSRTSWSDRGARYHPPRTPTNQRNIQVDGIRAGIFAGIGKSKVFLRIVYETGVVRQNKITARRDQKQFWCQQIIGNGEGALVC